MGQGSDYAWEGMDQFGWLRLYPILLPGLNTKLFGLQTVILLAQTQVTPLQLLELTPGQGDKYPVTSR